MFPVVTNVSTVLAATLLFTSSVGAVSDASFVQKWPIDANIWHPATKIRWPGVDREVFFTTDLKYLDPYLKQPVVRHFPHGKKSFSMGRVENKLVVIANDAGKPLQALGNDFVASHESFHLAAQYFGAKIPTDLIGVEVPMHIGTRRVERFWQSLIRVAKSPSNPSNCRSVSSAYRALNTAEKQHVIVRSYWEWPAEYYSRKSQLPWMSEAEYVRRRRAFDDGYLPYVSGSIALMSLDQLKPNDPAWQYRIHDGEHPMTVLLTEHKCPALFKTQLALEVTNLEF